MKEKGSCEYCLINKTTRQVRSDDGADYFCCKECYSQYRNGEWD